MSTLQLLAPTGLVALLGIPLVILFHMRNTTPIEHPVPSLRFWRLAIQEETHLERFKRPPFSLLFLLHLLLVAAIALALARPATSNALGGLGSTAAPTHVILLLDGSTSMSANASSGDGTRFELARSEVLNRLRQLNEGDIATIILMGTRISTFEATDAAAVKAISDRIRTLALPGGQADLNQALRLSRDLLLPSVADRIVVVSDGAVTVDPALVSAINAPIELVDVGNSIAGNVAITDIATRSSTRTPDQQQLYARIVNFGPTSVTAPVVILADGIEISRADVTVDPNGASEEIVQDLPAGSSAVTVQFDTNDALAADNVASSVLPLGADFGLNILLVTDIPTDLFRALTVLPGANVSTMSPTDAANTVNFSSYDLVVFERTNPPDIVPDVPLLLVGQPAAGMIPTEGIMADPSVQRVRAQDPLLAGVELSGITFGQTPDFVLDGTTTEIVGAETGPLLYRGTAATTGRPMIVVAFDLTLSNITQRVAFPVLIANIVGELAPSPLPSAIPLGETLLYQPRAGTATVRVLAPTGESVDLAVPQPEVISPGEPFRQVAFADTGAAGEYRISELDSSGTFVGGGRFIVNAGHAQESNLTPNLSLSATLGLASSDSDSSSESGLSDLWPILAAAALFLCLTEWLLLLFCGRGKIRRGRSTGASSEPGASHAIH